jgi:hypothetical protein
MVKISFTGISRVLEMINTALLYLKDLVIVKYSKGPLFGAAGMASHSNRLDRAFSDVSRVMEETIELETGGKDTEVEEKQRFLIIGSGRVHVRCPLLR